MPASKLVFFIWLDGVWTELGMYDQLDQVQTVILRVSDWPWHGLGVSSRAVLN